jgi:hypothetical protein
MLLMMKLIWSLGSAAALAVSATLVSVPAFAQAPPAFQWGAPAPHELAGSTRLRGDDLRGERRAPDFQTAQARCSREAIQLAWSRGYYSAQYDGKPRMVETRRGWEFRGRVRLHDQRGYSTVNTVCDLGGRGDVRIEFVR